MSKSNSKMGTAVFANDHNSSLYLQKLLGPDQWMEAKEDRVCYGTVVDLLLRRPKLALEPIRWGGNNNCDKFEILPLSLLLLSQNLPTLETTRLVYDLYKGPKNHDLRMMPRRPEYKFLYLSVLERYPELVTITDSEGGRILDFAFHHGYPLEILESIARTLPENQKTLTIRGPSSLSEERVFALKQLLQHNTLTQLQWVTYTQEGIQILLSCLEGGANKVNLDLKFSQIMTPTLPTFFQESLQNLIEQDRLESITIETNLDLDMVSVSHSLEHNQRLSVFQMNPPSITTQKDMKALLGILERNNATLQQVAIGPSLRKYSSCKRIAYFLELNKFGRRVARDPQTSPESLVELLVVVATTATPNYRHKLQYGLLRESPGIWSSACHT